MRFNMVRFNSIKSFTTDKPGMALAAKQRMEDMKEIVFVFFNGNY